MTTIKTVDDFAAFVAEIEARAFYRRPLAFGVGIAHVSATGNILDTFFPFPNYETNYGTAAVLADAVGHLAGTCSFDLSRDGLHQIMSCFAPFEGDGKTHGNIEALRDLALAAKYAGNSQRRLVVSFIDDAEHDSGPQTVSDAYLRLHLLSHRLVKPNCIKLDGIFGVLPNNAWTNEGPIALEDLPTRRIHALTTGNPLHITAVDKFPRMVDYVVPSGVRIADASRVRLGAYLGSGTTVMHEGFCNFNAGTLGTSMVEGRISAGVTIGDQSDLGGSSSTMGTLSGGGKEKIKIGRGCLIGANGGTGISLGDLCVIEAGLYITAGMLVHYQGKVVKARELSGQNGLTFRRNGETGHVEVLVRPNNVVLNEILHQN